MLVEVADAQALHEAVRQLQTDTVRRQQMGQAGLDVLKANQGALEGLLGGLERLLRAGTGATESFREPK
ncbi:3-deoxy-D-manno-octulosonic-acid transferase [compost metagenome]